MCDPVTITTLALSAASSFVQADATRRQSNQQADSLRAQYAANDAATQAQQQQIEEQSSQQMSERARQAMMERGRLAAIAADSGLGGNTQGRIERSIGFAEGTDMATLEANRQNAVAQGQRNKAAGFTQASGQIAALPMPSLLGMGLQIAGTTLGAYAGQPRAPANKAPSTFGP